MSRTVLYYFAPQSPWSYLGHARLVDLLARSRREVAVLPVDYGRIFPQSGGLPLAKRAPQRQAYRLVELKRFAEHLGLALNPQPRYFPVDATPSARLITAVAQQDGMAAAMALPAMPRSPNCSKNAICPPSAWPSRAAPTHRRATMPTPRPPWTLACSARRPT